MAEHPVEAHEYLLSDLKKRLEYLEDEVQELIKWKAGSEERLRTISEMLAELKRILEGYTSEMKNAMADLVNKIDGRFGEIEKDIQDIKGRPGRRWDDLTRTLITVLVSGAVGYLISLL